MKNPTKPRRKAGFSLVEVSIAMAIGAVALVSLIGLIPQGLKTVEEATDQSIEARIHQQILGELQLTPFRDKNNNPDLHTSPLKQFHRQVRIYDGQGVELGYQDRLGSFTKAPSSFNEEELDFNWNYTARIWMPHFQNGRVPPSMDDGFTFLGFHRPPGYDPTSSYGNSADDLLIVIVEIVPIAIPGNGLMDRLSSAMAFFNHFDNFDQIRSYQTTVVRMGHDFSQ